MKHWIKAFRLRTLPLSFSNILLGMGVALTIRDTNLDVIPFTAKNWTIFGLTLLTTLLLQVLSNLANDYGDAKKGADNEGRIGPERAIQSGAITPKAMFRAIVITVILSFISGITLLYVAFEDIFNLTFLSFVVLGLAAIAAAIKYTVGKGAYGYAGLGDLFVFLFFGVVGVLGTYYLQVFAITEEIREPFGFFLPAITMGCFSVAVLNLNNMRDRENDQKVGKNTLAVKLGFEKSKVYHYILFAVAYLSFPIPALIYPTLNLAAFIYILPVAIIHFVHLKKVSSVKDPKDFDPELKKVALSAFLFSLLFFGTVLFFR